MENLDWLSVLFRRSERVWPIGVPLYWKLAPPLSQTLSRPYHFRLGQHSRVLYGQVCYISCLVRLLEPCFIWYSYQNYALLVGVTGTMPCLMWLLKPCFVCNGYWNHALFSVVIRDMLCLVW